MSILSKFCSVAIGATLLSAAVTTVAHAQSYPTRAITFVIPFGPGGGVDVIGRVLGEALSRKLGYPVVIINRPGATGNIAIAYSAKAAPDGYTLLFTNAIPIVVNPVVTDNFPFVIADAFVPVSKVGDTSSYILAVNASLQVKTVSDLLSYAKANPGKINYASGGFGSINHLAMELFKSSTGADLTHIPYQAGASAAVIAVIGNEVQAVIGGISSVLPHVQSGRLRPLAVTSDARPSQLPNVPTMKESGVGGDSFSIWYGLLAPKSTPAAVVAILNKAINDVLADPAVKDTFAKQAIDLHGGSPEEFGKLIATEGALWKEVAKKANLTGKLTGMSELKQKTIVSRP